MNSTENSVGDSMLSSNYALCVPYGMVGSMILREGGSFVATVVESKKLRSSEPKKNGGQALRRDSHGS